MINKFENLQQADINSILCDYETLTIIETSWFQEPEIISVDPPYVR